MSRSIRVCYVQLDGTGEHAWDWLGNQPEFSAERLAPGELDAALASAPDVVWLDALASPRPGTRLAQVVETVSPAGLLLTGGAVTLPSLIGIEPAAPNDRIDRTWLDRDDELFLHTDFAETPRVRGHAAFRRHSLFDGLGSGVYTWWPYEGERYRAVTYRAPEWPVAADVVAVERAFIHINADRATIWEYGPRRILCVGAYLPFESDDPLFRPHLERFAGNALRYLAGRGRRGTHDLHWHRPDPRTIEDPGLAVPRAARLSSEPLPLDLAPLQMGGIRAADPFTLAGRRTLAAGVEGNGLRELWVHPVRVMKDVALAGSRFESARITALGIERRIVAGNAPVVERVHVPRELPGLVIEWMAAQTDATSTGANRQPASVEIEWKTDLRLMWPYPAGALGPIHWNHGERTLVVSTPRSGETVCFAIDAPDDATISLDARDASSHEAPGLYCSLRARLSTTEPLRLVVAAAVAPGDDVAATLAALRNPAAHVRARTASLRRLAHDRLSLRSPDSRADKAVEWAKYRLDSFLVDVPGLGRSLVAGHWMSRPGWNDGRPGYAWFFGRDAAWTAFACLATGQFDAVRDCILFLARHQDLNGKILHECTTSGSIHYDAADSTPLWLLLVARYHAWTGDAILVRRLWPHVRQALDFCIATDRDGDGIIENPRVGHGWIEFGRLGGGRATLYNAGIWCAALRELATVAESIGDAASATELGERYRTAHTSLEERFYDVDRGAWALRIDPADYTPTATHAVPLLLGEIDPERAGGWLDLVASEDFTAPWGVRMLPASDPGFDPDSYHGGAVWPLYTGWASWAEFRAGRIDSAVNHWRQNLELAYDGARGAWDEALHGLDHRSIGVCPDQAWSTAMAVTPLVCGLLGAVPDAPANRIELRPRPPADWDHLEIRNLRFADASLSIRYRRDAHHHIFQLEQIAGPVPVTAILEPAVIGAALAGASVDGQPAVLDAKTLGSRLAPRVRLVLDHQRTLELVTIE